MKTKHSTHHKFSIISLALCAATCAAFGQGPGGGQGGPWGQQGGPGGPPPPPPLPPVIRALDTNHDHVIEADEIANAPQSLSTLLKSGSTSLSIRDLLGPPPFGRHHHGPPPPDAGTTGTDGQMDNPDSQNPPPPPPDDQNAPATSGTSDASPSPGERPHRRLPPVIKALDTNHDGIIEPDEIANAAQSLSTLLKSGSTSLSIPDLLGPPPFGRPPRGPGGDDGPPPPPPDESGTDSQAGPPPPQ